MEPIRKTGTAVVLIHWKPAEAQPHLEALQGTGIDVVCFAPDGAKGLNALVQRPPRAILIDLSRLPSHGLAVAVYLRGRAATRHVPLVFVGGEPKKVERVLKTLPDAAYLNWPEVPAKLEQAIREAPTSPVSPPAMAAYSGAPLAQKLGIKPHSAALLLGAPAGFESKLEPLPDGVAVTRSGRRADRVMLFCTSAADLRRRFPRAARSVAPDGGLWLIWPKRASGTRTDLSEPAIRRFGLEAGWVDYKICAADETWSGLLFARRAPKTG
ncbi:MAG: hypothetical protein ACRD9L_24785 [Bryobacteraceae bacterium]